MTLLAQDFVRILNLLSFKAMTTVEGYRDVLPRFKIDMANMASKNIILVHSHSNITLIFIFYLRLPRETEVI